MLFVPTARTGVHFQLPVNTLWAGFAATSSAGTAPTTSAGITAAKLAPMVKGEAEGPKNAPAPAGSAGTTGRSRPGRSIRPSTGTLSLS